MLVVHGELDHRVPRDISDEDLVNALSQYLDFAPLEKLALLEQNGPLARCESLVELLEIRALSPTTPRADGTVH